MDRYAMIALGGAMGAIARYQRAAGRFIDLANDFLGSLVSSGDASLAHLPRSLEPDVGFRAPRHFHFTDLMPLTAVSPLTWALDRFRIRTAATRAISTDASRYAERLLAANSSRIVFDLQERFSASRRAPESELRSLLNETSASAIRALKQAQEARDKGEETIARQLERLERHRATLLTILRP